MFEKWLDSYELKARVAPGLVLVVPLMVDGLYAAPILSNWPVFTASSAVGLALLYALGLLVRSLGERVQPQLWTSWGGPPSTRMVRHRDNRFGDHLKDLIYQSLSGELSVDLLSDDEEAKNPSRADKEIEDAFRQVREYLRANDPHGLWTSHNAEYGFYRNLLGSRGLWSIVALGSAIFAALYGVRHGSGPANPASLINAICFGFAIYLGWGVLPSATREAGEQYAESAWLAFLRKAQESKYATAVPVSNQE